MSDHMTWVKKTLGEILGEDRGIPDHLAEHVSKFTKADLDALTKDEREAAFTAFARIARQVRDERASEPGARGERPDYTESDIDWGLSAARSALEAKPLGERSEAADDLIADCECEATPGPNV